MFASESLPTSWLCSMLWRCSACDIQVFPIISVPKVTFSYDKGAEIITAFYPARRCSFGDLLELFPIKLLTKEADNNMIINTMMEVLGKGKMLQ